MLQEPYIKLKAYKIMNLSYSNTLINKKNKKNNFSLVPNLKVRKDKKNGILNVKVDLVKFINEKNCLEVLIEIDGIFEISNELYSDEAKMVNVLYVNGTAMLYPYVRAIISMITGLDSTTTVLLPTINTLDLLKEAAKKQNGSNNN
ncbi:MAG: protein-export chaperone SecB [Liquorilactobacillus ghanensis]|uniref:protein-export chaperone SecB n=1 Tax=Liquorilactobacillus ghanensis TaxID=399370 RepID=UPI0039ED8E03